jgi:hypothetical protein
MSHALLSVKQSKEPMPAYDPDRPGPTFAPKMSTARGVLILDEALQSLRPHLPISTWTPVF